MDQAVLSVAGVRKSFGPRQVLKGVDLCVRRGRILGLMGVNGAGKTTLLSVIAGLRRPDAGRVRIAGVDVSRDRTAAAHQPRFQGPGVNSRSAGETPGHGLRAGSGGLATTWVVTGALLGAACARR